MDIYSITSVFVCGYPSYNLSMRHALPIIALLSVTACGSDPDPVTVAPTTASAVMIDDDPQHNARRFSRPVSDVDIEDFVIWHGHDLTDPRRASRPISVVLPTSWKSLAANGTRP